MKRPNKVGKNPRLKADINNYLAAPDGSPPVYIPDKERAILEGKRLEAKKKAIKKESPIKEKSNKQGKSKGFNQ